MRYVVIMAAMEEEAEPIRARMSEAVTSRVHGVGVTTGEIGGMSCALAVSGIGKVNAARVAQLLIERFEIDYMVCVGSSGALNNFLDFGDIVISKSCVQFDFDLTIFGHEKGFIPKAGRFFETSPAILECAIEVAKDFRHGKVKAGIVATADVFWNDPRKKRAIFEEFHADCDDMESAAAAQVCRLCMVPFVAIRAISDKPKNTDDLGFHDHLGRAAENCAEFLDMLIRKYKQV